MASSDCHLVYNDKNLYVINSKYDSMNMRRFRKAYQDPVAVSLPADDHAVFDELKGFVHFNITIARVYL